MKRTDEKSMIRPLDIGGVLIPNNLILGPMAGVTDPPFRLLCREQGAGLVCMEMVSAKALSYHNKKSFDLLKTYEKEHPVSLQLFGNEPSLMAEVVKSIEEYDFDIIDINMGCPVPKVVNNGEGSALMKDPLLCGRIIKAVADAAKKPVTVKIRSGFNEADINACEIAHIAQESGAKAVAVHARTREQYYSGKADWDVIKSVKESVDIPVIGNGDILGLKDIKAMWEQTGCDGFMIARGAQGDPWIFSRILSGFNEGKEEEKPTRREVAEMVLRHAKALVSEKGDYIAMREMRKHAGWYVAGYPKAAELRKKINETETLEELKVLMEEFCS